MRRFGSRSEIRSRLTKLQWLFRYPRSEPIARPGRFRTRSTSLPFGRAKRRRRSIAQLAVAIAARPRSPDRPAFPSVRDGLLLLTSSPSQAYSQPLAGSGPRCYPGNSGIAGQSRRASAQSAKLHRSKLRVTATCKRLCCFFGSFSKDPIRH
jgi:hypothetical protein